MKILDLTEEERKTYFVEKFICASAANHYNSDGSGSLRATAQIKSYHLKTFGVQY
jgi:hypothetical protein